jgi:hypothetical protein
MDFPDKDRCCHRTGFEKSCLELVATRKCQRWRKVYGQPAGEVAPRDIYDCIDDHAHTLRINAIASTDYAGAATDKMHNGIAQRYAERSTMIALTDERHQ